MAGIPVRVNKVLYKPAEPAAKNEIYWVQPDPSSPVEWYVTNEDGYVKDTGNTAFTIAAMASLMALKAPLASPSLTGTPTAPTAAPGTNTTQIATTAFVIAVRDAILNAAPGVLDTLQELAAALGNDPNFAASTAALIATKGDKSAIIPSGMLLSSTGAINLNDGTAAKQNLFTVPASKRAIITRIDPDKFSAVPTNAQVTFGWNNAANDALTDPINLADVNPATGKYITLLQPSTPMLVGTSGQVLGVSCSTAEGSVLTGRFNVFGYLTDASGVPVTSLV